MARRARLRRRFALGLAQAAGLSRSALHRLRARQRVARHQRHRADQRQRQCDEPDAGVPAQGRGAGGRVPSLWHPRVSHGALQRAHGNRRARRPPIRSIPACSAGGRRRPTRSTGSFRISAAFWSRPIRKASPARRTTAARMPTAPTCWPMRVAAWRHVIWRAFVYSHEQPDDRAKQAYDEFVPLDGKFRDNVLVQVKNGAIDFQPREPFHPLFGAMPKTPLAMEFQITKEYLGFATHLVYLGAVVRRSAAGRHLSPAQGLDGGEGDRRLAARLRAHRHRRRGQHRHGPQLERLAVRSGQLVRVRPPGVESRCCRRKAIAEEWVRMTFSNDAEVRRARRRA